MEDKDKIIIMTKLAIYDKQYGEKDRKINEYFADDYVYRKNFWTRFCVTIACILVILLYCMHRIIIDEVDILKLNYYKEATNILLFISIVIVVYSLISSKTALSDYIKSQKRLGNYFKLIDELEEQKKKPEMETEEASKGEADIVYTGNDY